MAKNFIDLIMQHEDLEPGQTPFRITSPKMAEWTSMFDDSIKLKLNPKAKKSKGRENFLYTENPEDVKSGVEEQFRRYRQRNPEITVEDAIKIFDQTGAKGKLKFLKDNGIDTQKKLLEYVLNSSVENLSDEMEGQLA